MMSNPDISSEMRHRALGVLEHDDEDEGNQEEAVASPEARRARLLKVCWLSGLQLRLHPSPRAMEPKQQTATSRASYFGNMKSRLGDRLPVSVTQPQGFPRGQWDAPPCPRATDEVSMPRHHIRNPKLRQYYLKEATLPCDVSTVQSSSGNEQGVHREDTVFSVASQFSRRQGDTLSTRTTLLHAQLSATPPYSGSEPSLGAMTPATPVSPSTDAEYDKLLDVEAVPMPDGQLCLLALPPECTQGAGPADMPYLKLFCRFITDRKGVVSGILLVTPNKIFFDPHKTLPLVQENGCEEYLFSCLLDNLTSITFFSDISHVHFSCSTQKWKGRKRAWKHRASKTLDKETTQTKTPTVPTVMSDLGVGLEAGAGEDEGGESQDMAEVERQLEHLVLGAGMLNSAATFCCGGVDAGIGASAEPTQVQKEARLSGPGEQLRSSTSFLMFVRMRQKQPTTRRRGFAALELSKAKTTPLRDAWFALQQEKSDELYAYLSQRRPDLSILEGAEEEEDEDDFVLLDDREDREEGETEGSPRHGHTGDEWEMVCVEDNRARISVSADREPEGLCDILKQSLILDAQQVRELTGELPARTVGHTWRLAYSTSQHGSSLKTLYRRLSPSDSPVLLIIRDHNQQAFGAFLSHPLCPSEKFYGTGESFLFLLHPRFKCFHWTGENSFFIKGDLDSFAIGGGSGHFGLWLDETLYLGRSNPCATFSNCSLSEESDFRVLQLEAWTFW